jgi:hypothetical protein
VAAAPFTAAGTGAGLDRQMVALILTVCALANPAECREEIIPLEGVKITRCMLDAQAVIEQWSQAHPKWKITAWKCGAPDQGKQI